MATRIPAEAFPPGEILSEELEARDWTQNDLAEIIGRTPATVNEIIKGKRAITPDMSVSLGAAFDQSPEHWLRLEQEYTLWRMAKKSDDLISRRAKVYSYAPVTDMVKRGWIKKSESIDVLEKSVLTFFESESLEEEIRPLAHAARKSTSYAEETTLHQLAWLYRARHLAKAIHAQPFSPSNVDKAVRRLRLLVAPEELRQVPTILSEAGIRFVVVQPLQGTRIDGACFWIDKSPVIALSLRYDRIDNFWFTLLHECAHCRHQNQYSLDTDLGLSPDDADRPQIEKDADEFATMNLVNQDVLKDFIIRKKPLFSTIDIRAFAHSVHVHPGVIVGQLQHRKQVPWQSFRNLLVPIRDIVTSTTLTDGWGVVAPPSA